MIEFTSGRPTFDVDVARAARPEAPRLQGQVDGRPAAATSPTPSMTSPDFDLADFGRRALNFATQADGAIDDASRTSSTSGCSTTTRRSSTRRASPIPTSMDDIVTAAAKLHDPSKGVYGFVSRGLKNANIPVWTSWLLGQGLETIDPATGKLQHRRTRGDLGGASSTASSNKDFAPPGTIGFNWNECQTTFAQGRAAMWLDGIGFAHAARGSDQVQDRRQGRLRRDADGPEGASLGDLRAMAWASPSVQEEGRGLALHPVGDQQGEPARHAEGRRRRAGAHRRRSTIRRRIRSSPSPRNSSTCMAESGKIGRPGLPQIIPVTEFRDIFGVALTNMLVGRRSRDRAEEGDRSVQARCSRRPSRADRRRPGPASGRGSIRARACTLPAPVAPGTTVTATPR